MRDRRGWLAVISVDPLRCEPRVGIVEVPDGRLDVPLEAGSAVRVVHERGRGVYSGCENGRVVREKDVYLERTRTVTVHATEVDIATHSISVGEINVAYGAILAWCYRGTGYRYHLPNRRCHQTRGKAAPGSGMQNSAESLEAVTRAYQGCDLDGSLPVGHVGVDQ